MTKQTCSLPECDRTRATREYCAMHYARWKRLGDPRSTRRIVANDEDRFDSKVDRSGDCHVWIAYTTPQGYGRFYADGKMWIAHRWAYRRAHGTLPEGLELDHLCRNRACVNPAHLEAVTKSENQLRGLSAYAIRDVCRNGLHDITDPANIKLFADGRRTCAQCFSARRTAEVIEP